MVLMGDFVHHDGAEGRRRFEELLAKRFPSIAAQIDEIERGLLHLEMGAFARPTCNAIDSGDSEEVATHLAFIDQFFVDAPPDLENAIYVSYLKDVFLGRDDERYFLHVLGPPVASQPLWSISKNTGGKSLNGTEKGLDPDSRCRTDPQQSPVYCRLSTPIQCSLIGTWSITQSGCSAVSRVWLKYCAAEPKMLN